MANADEETGGKWGEWVAENHFDKIEAEFVLNEGGWNDVWDCVMFLCSNAEKANGETDGERSPGHGRCRT
jgi:hypothetical protein